MTNLIQKFKNSSAFNSLLLAILQSIVAFLFIAIDFVFSKQISVAEMGMWKEVMFVVNLAIPMLSFGIPEGYKYFLAKENTNNLFPQSFTAILTITACLLSVILLLNIFHYFQIVSIKEYYLISFFFPLAYFSFVMNKVMRYYYINTGKIDKYSIILIAYFVLSLILIGLPFVFSSLLQHHFLSYGLLIYVSIFGFPIYHLLRDSKLRTAITKPTKKVFAPILHQGIPLYIASFIGIAVVNMDKIIVRYFEDREAFAIFSVGAIEIPVFAMLSAAFSQNIFPQLVKYVNSDNLYSAKKLWLNTTLQVSYITYPLLLILMFFAKEIIYFIYSADYKDSVILFKTYLLVGLFRNNSYGSLIIAQGKTKLITFYSALTLVFNLIFSLILYQYIGLNGIMFGTFFSTMFVALLQLQKENILYLYFRDFLFNYRIATLVILILLCYIFK